MKVKTITSFALGPLLSAVVGLVTVPVLAWYLPAEHLGRFALLQVAINLGLLVLTLGLDQVYVREFHENSDRNSLLKLVLLPGLLVLVLTFIFFIFYASQIASALFGEDSTSMGILLMFCLLFVFLSRFLSLALRMNEAAIAYSVNMLLGKIIYLIGVLVYVSLTQAPVFFGLIVCHAIALGLVTVSYAWITRAEWSAAIRGTTDLGMLKRYVGIGFPLVLAGAAFWCMTSLDRLFLRQFSTFEELGIYAVASSFAGAAIILQGIFSTVWVPLVYKWASEGCQGNLMEKGVEYLSALTVFVFSLAGLASASLDYILPESYGQVKYIMMACMAYPLFYTLSELGAAGIGIARRTKLAMLAAVIAALVNLLANWMLVPPYGAGGASIATACAFWLFLILRTEFCCLAWRPIPRLKMYSTSFLCLLASIVAVIVGPDSDNTVIALWSASFLLGVLIFRKAVSDSIVFVSNSFKKARKTTAEATGSER